MKIDVSYDAMLQALVEAVRDERDHGAAVMSLVSRLVEEARQQDWFEAHWRTDARLRLAQMACGQMPKAWRSPAPVLEVIAEAARSALKADEVDSESRAILLAIMRLADVEHSAKSVTKPEPRPALKHPRRRKANGAGSVRRGRAAAQLPKLPAPSQAMAKARPAAGKSAPARKAKRSKAVSRSHAPAQPAKPVAPAHAAPIAKARPAAGKSAPVRKAKRSKPVSRSHTAKRSAKPVAPAHAAQTAKARPAAGKSAPARKTKRSKPVSRSHTAAHPAKPAAAAHAAPIAPKASLPAKSAPVRKPNGAGQASTKLGAPAIVT